MGNIQSSDVKAARPVRDKILAMVSFSVWRYSGISLKSLLGHMPEYISDLLTLVANIPGRSTLRASSCGNLVVPWTCQRIGDRTFSVAAPRAWNRLLTELKLLQLTDLFRRDLKTFLFNSV